MQLYHQQQDVDDSNDIIIIIAAVAHTHTYKPVDKRTIDRATLLRNGCEREWLLKAAHSVE